MTERDWNSCTDPQKMLLFLRDSGRASERKLRLLSCAFWRAHAAMLQPHQLSAVVVAERYADGQSDRAELARCRPLALGVAAGSAMTAAHYALRAVESLDWAGQGAEFPTSWDEALRRHRLEVAERACPIIRHIFGNALGPVGLDSSWLTRDVLALALAAYDDRSLPCGHLDTARLAVLADALLDAGCPQDAEILLHLRGDAAHVRGCWAVDAILGKS